MDINTRRKDELNVLEKIYNARQCDFEKRANIERKELASKLNEVTLEEMEKITIETIKEQEKRQEVLEKLDQLVENYEIKMAYYMEERYKQGFKDGVNLMKECNENKW